MGPAALLVLSLALSALPEEYDTVLLTSGGVLRGTVVQNVPGSDLVLLMPDGSTRSVPRAEVFRVDYAAPRLPPAAAPRPPEAEAPAPAPPAAVGLQKVLPMTFSMALGGAIPLGSLGQSGFPLGDATTSQFSFLLEGAWRPVEPFAIGAYLRIAGGGSQPPANASCLAVGEWCDTFGGGLGLFARWSFAPREQTNPWVALAFGGEAFSFFADSDATADYYGWELGASGGVDWRLSEYWGIGLYAGARLGSFTSVEVTGLAPVPWPGTAVHGWLDAGVRFVFGP